MSTLVNDKIREEIKSSVLSVTEYNIGDYSGPRVLICGSREGYCVEAIPSYISAFGPNVIIIQGGAKGADTDAGREAVRQNLHMVCVEADWERYGKFAGKYRNEAMAKMLRPQDSVIAFWDGRSPGTRHMVEHARKMGFEVLVIGPTGDILAHHQRWEGESCPSCGAAKRGDIPECPVCKHKHHGEFYTLGVDNGAAGDDLVVDDEVKARLRNRCPECNADLEKMDGPVCDCGAPIAYTEHDGRQGEHDQFNRTCDECGSDISDGKCECGAHHGEQVEPEIHDERREFLGNKFYLNEHAKDCRCETCRKARLRKWVASEGYRRLYKTIGVTSCRCEQCRKARFWERVFSGSYRREYRPVGLPK